MYYHISNHRHTQGKYARKFVSKYGMIRQRFRGFFNKINDSTSIENANRFDKEINEKNKI